jgi:hypothetical protein
MSTFTGKSIADITKLKQSDVFNKVDQTVVGLVSVPAGLIAGDAVPMGTLLLTSDGGKTWSTRTTPDYAAGSYALDDEVYYEGHIFKSTAAANVTVPGVGDWTDLGAWNANGILFNDLTESKNTTVVVTGTVAKKTLSGYDEFLHVVLFNNKIIVK